MTDDMPAPDQLYYAIKAQPGWSDALREAEVWRGPLRTRVGAFISAVLLATDDAADVLVVAGELSEEGAGMLVVLTTTDVIHARVTRLDANHSDFVVTSHPLGDVEEVSVTTRHSYYEGTDGIPRETGIQLRLTVGGHEVNVREPRFDQTAWTRDSDVLAAFHAIRKARAAAR